MKTMEPIKMRREDQKMRVIKFYCNLVCSVYLVNTQLFILPRFEYCWSRLCKPISANEDGQPKRKKTSLHKTSSVFMRNVPPTVKIADLEAVSQSSFGLVFSGVDIVSELMYVTDWEDFKTFF